MKITKEMVMYFLLGQLHPEDRDMVEQAIREDMELHSFFKGKFAELRLSPSYASRLIDMSEDEGDGEPFDESVIIGLAEFDHGSHLSETESLGRSMEERQRESGDSSLVSSLFEELIAATSDATLSPVLYEKVRAADLTHSGIYHLRQELAAGANARVGGANDADKKKKEDDAAPVERHLFLDGDVLRLSYPEAWLPNGLAWVVYLGNDRRATRQLIQLRLAFGAWDGSIKSNQLTGESKAYERYFYVVPVSEEHLESTSLEIRAFIESLADGPQKFKAQTWLKEIDSKGAAS